MTSDDLPLDISRPALAALANAGITNLRQLAAISRSELRTLHGVGPKAIAILEAEMKARGYGFAEDV